MKTEEQVLLARTIACMLYSVEAFDKLLPHVKFVYRNAGVIQKLISFLESFRKQHSTIPKLNELQSLLKEACRDGKISLLEYSYYSENLFPLLSEYTQDFTFDYWFKHVADEIFRRKVELIVENADNTELLLNTLSKQQIKYFELFERREDVDVERLLKEETIIVGGVTGLYLLDDVVKGYPKKAYTLVAGKTGLGKTYFMLNSFLQSLKKGYECIFVSGEMSIKQILVRLAMLWNGYKPEDLRNRDYCFVPDDLLEPSDATRIGWNETPNYDELFSDFITNFVERYDVKNRIVTVDTLNTALSLQYVESFIKRELENGKRIDCIFIDAPEAIIVPEAKYEGADIIIKSNFFNRISHDYNLAVVSSWQITKAGYKKQTKVSEDLIKGRAEIQQLASMIFLLAQTDAEKSLNVTRLKITKNRFSMFRSADYFIWSSAVVIGEYCYEMTTLPENKVEDIAEKYKVVANELLSKVDSSKQYDASFEDGEAIEDDFAF